jgi:phytochromobilin:ferredoxin oxidoreductase
MAFCLQLLPWGGELTTEAMQFFSPLLLWSRPKRDDQSCVEATVFSVFKDYLQVITMHNLADNPSDPIFRILSSVF